MTAANAHTPEKGSALPQDNPQTTYSQTTIKPDSFWGRRRQVVRAATLRYQLDMLKETGRYDSFKSGFWHKVFDEPIGHWPVPKHLFWDSDLAKWIEGACYLLADEKTAGKDGKSAQIESAIEELVERFKGAQGEDGYLNLHYQLVERGMRWTNLRDMHELYNAGHLIESAVAHHQHYGNNELLDTLLKYVALIGKTFGDGPGQLRGYPGHPEIELALLRLYKVTGDEEHLRLAKFFIEERGNPKGVDGKHYYDVESKRRGDAISQMPVHFPYQNKYTYLQAHASITDQATIEGHSVRAMYLLTAVADLCTLSSSSKTKYISSLHRLWDNMTYQKMSLTGGIGAISQWEGFGIDYFLPQGTDDGGCYNETCAAIGVVMLAERMLVLELDNKYADILELSLYNALLTGMSHDGTAFTYVNQLASSDADLSKRESWFDCACCPPNVTRVLGYLAGYVWHHRATGEKEAEVNVFLYMDAEARVEVGAKTVRVRQETKWPLEGKVEFWVEDAEGVDVTLRLRIPAWAEEWEVSPKPSSTELTKGFLTLDPEYIKQNSNFTLNIPMTPRLVRPHPYTNQPVVAVARGPVVYCVEDVDNEWVDDHFKSTIFDTSAKLTEETRTDVFEDDEELIGITAEKAASTISNSGDADPVLGSSTTGEKGEKKTLRFIPYYARANRADKSKGMMRVGLRVV